MLCDFNCTEFNRYRVDLPYPSTSNVKPNPGYGQIISDAYAGQGSETTAIAQYWSHRYFVKNLPDVYVAYKYITIVETTHLELLGNLIQALGLNPLFYSYEARQYWSGYYPDYQLELNQILLSDIQGEREAITHYNQIINSIDEKSIQALVRRIILDEEKHIEELTNLYVKYYGTSR
jgi:bacterioferritin